MRLSTRLTICFGALLAAGSAFAQSGTISTTAPGFLQLVDGGWTYRVDSISSTAVRIGSFGGSGNYTRGSAPNHMAQHWWWYRGSFVGGPADTREFALSNLVPALSSAGAVPGQYAFGVLTYDEPVAGVANALRFRLSYAFDGIDNGAVGFQNLGVAIMSVRWTVTNTSNRDIEVNFFNYLSLTIVGPSGIGSGNDRVRLDIWNPGAPIGAWAKIWDSPASTTPPNIAPGFEGFNYIASGANLFRYQLTSPAEIRTVLINANVDDLNNTVTNRLTYFAGAYQWRFTLRPGESADGWVTVAVNAPEPASMLALGVGLAGLVGLRRRRK